jgi:hypothetical protein
MRSEWGKESSRNLYSTGSGEMLSFLASAGQWAKSLLVTSDGHQSSLAAFIAVLSKTTEWVEVHTMAGAILRTSSTSSSGSASVSKIANMLVGTTQLLWAHSHSISHGDNELAVGECS